MINEGNLIIQKIEHYRQVHNQLPNSLTDIGIEIKSESDPPLYYDKMDNLHYTISFGTSLGESKIYYSDSKQWEDFYREMR